MSGAEPGSIDESLPLERAAFPVLVEQPTRWADNDHYGHVNNAVYYFYFDSAVNAYLLASCDDDIRELPQIGVVVETACRHLASVSFPDLLHVGLSVARLGRTSVTYHLALFRENGQQPAAVGRFVHVYVDQQSRRPVPVPAVIREAVTPLIIVP